MLNDKYSFHLWLNNEIERQRSRQRGTYRKRFIGSRAYPHFDSTISLNNSEQIGLLEHRIVYQELAEKWNFYPFIKKEQRNRRYRHRNSEKNKDYYGSPFLTRNQKNFTHIKSRPIMYASHQDACLLAYTSFLLSTLYEQEIKKRNLTKNVIAYRSIRGRNNVDFAHDTFRFLKSHSNYACILIDVKSFFDTVSHYKLMESVESLTQAALPPDLSHVLSNITEYRYVIDDEVIKCLKQNNRKYFIRDRNQGFKLCKLEDFNELINNKRFIRTNRKTTGIPQGSPISGLLANISLLDFDAWINNRLSLMDFYLYQRYSDDIVTICPQEHASLVYLEIKKQLKNYQLTLSSKKTEAFGDKKGQLVNIINELEPFNNSSRSNMQYLGLEWNGKQITLRPGTLNRRFRPKKPLTSKYWGYHRSTIKKVGGKALSKQFDRMRKTAKQLEQTRNKRQRDDGIKMQKEKKVKEEVEK